MIHELPNNYYAVQIPRDASNPEIIGNELGESWGCGEEFELWETLPSGQWQIVGMAGELTEEQAGEIVDYNDEPHGKEYREYGGDRLLVSALESFSSLLASLSIEASNLLIIKKGE